MLSEEQKKIRRNGVGGSEIAAVAGLSPWISPVEIWQKKIGLAKDDDDGNYHTERGTFLEEGLANWLEYRTGYEVRKVGTIVHPEHPFVIATPDGAAHDVRNGKRIAAVEIKSPDFRISGDWEDPTVCPDGIPHYNIPQVIWECAVLDVDRCDVAALIGGDLKVYTVPYNAKLFDTLRAKAEQFMEYVVKEEPPPIDGSDSASRWLKKRFPEHDEAKRMLTSDNAIEEHIHSLKNVRARLGILEEDKRFLENKIKEYIGNAPGVQGPWGKITWKKTKDRQGYDTKSLVEHLKQNSPEILKGFFRKTPGPRTFRPYWKEV